MLKLKIYFTQILPMYLVDVFVLFSADDLLYDFSFSSYQSQIKHTLSFFPQEWKNRTVYEYIFSRRLIHPCKVHCKNSAYLVRPVSGSTTLRITLCLASYSSLVSGLFVESRAFCSSVITTQKNTIQLNSWCLPHKQASKLGSYDDKYWRMQVHYLHSPRV